MEELAGTDRVARDALGLKGCCNERTCQAAIRTLRATAALAGLALPAGARAAKQPAISVDTKKKELIGDFKNPGRQWRPKGKPVEVRTKDFKDKALGKVNPYGIYDLALDEGYVSVGIDADTAQFAVASIRSWWRHLGPRPLPRGDDVDDHRRLRRLKRQPAASVEDRAAAPADQTGLSIRVCHFPPGTSKWNKAA
jgi:hypothetical protein